MSNEPSEPRSAVCDEIEKALEHLREALRIERAHPVTHSFHGAQKGEFTATQMVRLGNVVSQVLREHQQLKTRRLTTKGATKVSKQRVTNSPDGALRLDQAVNALLKVWPYPKPFGPNAVKIIKGVARKFGVEWDDLSLAFSKVFVWPTEEKEA